MAWNKLTAEKHTFIASLIILCIGILLPTVMLFIGVAFVLIYSMSDYCSLIGFLEVIWLPIILMSIGLFHFFVTLFQLNGWLLFKKIIVDCDPKEMSKQFIHQLLSALTIAISLIASLAFCIWIIITLEKQIDMRIENHLRNYRVNGYMKESIDKLQISFECCGRYGYKDWFDRNWIRIRYLPFIFPQPEDNLHDSVPFSCCDARSTRPCNHYGVSSISHREEYDSNADLTIYTKGCTPVLANFVKNIYWALIGLIVILLSLQLIIAIITKFFYTTYCVAKDEGAVYVATAEPPKGFLCNDKEEDHSNSNIKRIQGFLYNDKEENHSNSNIKRLPKKKRLTPRYYFRKRYSGYEMLRRERDTVPECPVECYEYPVCSDSTNEYNDCPPPCSEFSVPGRKQARTCLNNKNPSRVRDSSESKCLLRSHETSEWKRVASHHQSKRHQLVKECDVVPDCLKTHHFLWCDNDAEK